ncbi:MAG: PE-PPE domain-containing protein, partial [Mycobacterium sp.]|nr:PE-PPE domain-containing protein [Mycobacterium sp.]
MTLSTGLTATTALHTTATARGSESTVLTLEGGIVGAQNLVRFTPLQLSGKLCQPPNRCRPVDYPALPGEEFNQQGADILAEAIAAATAGGEPVTLFGHSQGGQVIHVLLRRWAADPDTAPHPDLVSWVSIGNPENPMGGTARKPGFPADTPYRGTEVIRQYDGWADWPSAKGNLLAAANAAVGALMAHPNYFRVDLDDPANVRHTPANADGTPGAVTYVWVPTPLLPLVAGAGILAPALDSMLRPIVEAGYDRPVDLGTGEDPDPGQNPGTGRPAGPDDRRTARQAAG